MAHLLHEIYFPQISKIHSFAIASRLTVYFDCDHLAGASGAAGPAHRQILSWFSSLVEEHVSVAAGAYLTKSAVVLVKLVCIL